MSNLINMLSDFFDFIIEQLGNVADFFTSNTLGVIILACTLFYVVSGVILKFINKGK